MATKGQWNIFGINIPDFGFTEKLPFLSGFDNPAIQQQAQKQLVSPIPTNTIGTSNFNVPNKPSSNTSNGQTQYTQPQQQVQQQQQQNTGGKPNYKGSNVNEFVNGWRWDGNTWQAPAGTSGGSSAQQEDYTQQINDIYNPAFASLAAQEAFLRGTELPNALSGLDSQKADLLGQLGLQQTKQQQSLDAQQQQLGDNQTSAFQQARDAYNSLNQQNMARFGGGSSAGGAVGELAQKEFAKQQGLVQQTYASGIKQLQSNQANLVDTVAQSTMSIERQHADQRAQITQTFNQKLNDINANRNTLDSAKASAKLQLVQQAVEAEKALRAQKETALFNLSLFQQQSQQELDNQLQLLSAQNQGTGYNFANQQSQIPAQQQAISNNNVISQLPNYNNDNLQGLRDPYKSGDLNQLINPFTA